MRKITYFLSLLLTLVGVTANAQTTPDELFEKPQFGGTVWTWNTSTNKFDAEDQTSTATPGRNNNKGPVCKFENAGTVTAAAGGDTSDSGGIWVIGNTSNITFDLKSWAGSILVEDYAVATVSYGFELKNTEPEGVASLWTNGTVNFANSRTSFAVDNNGKNQRWYIGENGVINTAFNTTNGKLGTWDIQVVVADQPVRSDGTARTMMTLQKKVMTWGADMSSHISSITVWHKDDAGNMTKLDNAVSYDATGVTITYEGLGYDEKTPSLPYGKIISVSDTKADFLVPATDAADNSHWYLLTQKRGIETPLYDNNGTEKLRRSPDATLNLNNQFIPGNEKYLVRFFANGEGTYDIQFATGKFITHELYSGTYAQGGKFNLYNINNEATHIGWNKANMANIVDNDAGPNYNLSYWGTGEVTQLNGNNDWGIYAVEFIDPVEVTYTLHSNVLNENYTGSYAVGNWNGNDTALPQIAGVTGYTLENVVFTQNGENYSMTADITFPFPVSNATVQNATGIESNLGTSKWFVNANNIIKANNTANYLANYALTWNIIPSFDNGTFSFKIKNVLTGKYIPAFTGAQGYNTANTVVEEENAGSFYFMPCIGTEKGFSINEAGTIFLSIGSDNADQNIYTWTKGGTHRGSNLAFPTITVTDEDIKNSYDTKVANYTSVEKFDILEGSTVVAPNEFRNTPVEINAAIDQLISNSSDNKYTEMDEIIRGKNTETQIIQNYLDVLNQFKMQAFTCKLDGKHQYNTIILPGGATIPEGLKVYTCSGIEDNGTTLVLTEKNNSIDGSQPYIVESTVGNKYSFVVWDYGNRSTHTVGLLTGVLTEGGANVPANSYVLAYKKSANVQAFYQTDGTVTCPQTKCYLTAPATMASAKAFFLGHNGESTGIEDVFNGKNGETVIYNTAGQRINKLQKGINIVNGHKVLVK